jgi:hypothetical protein
MGRGIRHEEQKMDAGLLATYAGSKNGCKVQKMDVRLLATYTGMKHEAENRSLKASIDSQSCV